MRSKWCERDLALGAISSVAMPCMAGGGHDRQVVADRLQGHLAIVLVIEKADAELRRLLLYYRGYVDAAGAFEALVRWPGSTGDGIALVPPGRRLRTP